jgi:putative hydrolase of the HAD superfamily
MIKALFIDIGGVLLTDGWNGIARKEAAERFGLEQEEMDERHRLTFDTYEEGKITLDEYLRRLVFYHDRSFSMEDFKRFMLSRSEPFSDMIDGVTRLKRLNKLKVAVISNEGRELTEFRILRFGLSEFVDFFISSCFVHLRKPDPQIYTLALDVAQVRPEEVIYVEDRPMFIQVAKDMGIRGIRHRSAQETLEQLKVLGLR